MGLIDKIIADESADMQRRLEDLDDEVRDRQDRLNRRASIVYEHVKQFAELNNVDFAELRPIKNTRYFAVGGMVLCVRVHGHTSKDALLDTNPRQVLWQHSVALGGVDLMNFVHEVGRGTLQLLDYNGIRKGYKEGASRSLDFNQSAVAEALLHKSS